MIAQGHCRHASPTPCRCYWQVARHPSLFRLSSACLQWPPAMGRALHVLDTDTASWQSLAGIGSGQGRAARCISHICTRSTHEPRRPLMARWRCSAASSWRNKTILPCVARRTRCGAHRVLKIGHPAFLHPLSEVLGRGKHC